ncbi:hypothetical protein JK208_05390 [Gluconobacter sp. Dm-74]|uniref:hypothetical protein n=1 Tax=Gluconobacter sp. Dm-74 TaxID=2799803 RepID=UPI001B8D8014|nr:hypothetical protein [Gluconobacter sp. Dm-74]MBS1091039.1 hypothetical protein [Gluconobacter sp. Dm-74]
MKRLALLLGLCAPALAFAQSVPTMNPRVTLAGPTGLNAAMATKADTANGTLSTPTINGGSVNGTSLVNTAITGTNPAIQLQDTSTSNDTARWQFINYLGTFQLNAVNDANTANNNAFTCSRNGYTVTGCSFAAPLTTSAGTFGSPAAGDVLGLWPNLYFAPNPNFSGTLTIAGAALPTLNLKSTSANVASAIYQGTDGALNLQPNGAGAGTNVFNAGSSFYVHDSVGSAQINMLAAGQSNPVTIWQDTQGNAWFSPTATNADNTIVANGTGTLYLNANSIQFNNPFLSDISKCGNISGATGCLEVKNDGGDLGYIPWFKAN